MFLVRFFREFSCREMAFCRGFFWKKIVKPGKEAYNGKKAGKNGTGRAASILQPLFFQTACRKRLGGCL
jgi:hypothetical protein